MSTSDKIRNALNEAEGYLKERVGQATNNASLEDEGRLQQAQSDVRQADVRQAGEHGRDAARDVLERR